MMSYHMALPHEGYIEPVLHIFANFGNHHNAEMIFDPSHFVAGESKYQFKSWT